MRSCRAVGRRSAACGDAPKVALPFGFDVGAYLAMPFAFIPFAREPLVWTACRIGTPCGFTTLCDLTLCDLMVADRRIVFDVFTPLVAGVAARNLARFWAARTSAFTSSSLRIECQPERPLFFAISARSFQLCVFREAVV